eukprot:4948290-Karenia_brevis.AAC.1
MFDMKPRCNFRRAGSKVNPIFHCSCPVMLRGHTALQFIAQFVSKAGCTDIAITNHPTMNFKSQTTH